MKKTILFYSALFFTVAGMSQTHVQSQQAVTGASQVQKQPGAVSLQGASSASSATTVQTDAAAKAASNTKGELAAKKQMIATEGEQAAVKVNNTAEKAASKEVGSKASVDASSDVNAGNQKSIINAEGHLHSESIISLNKENNEAVDVKKEVETRIEDKPNTTLEKTPEVATSAHTRVGGTINHQSGVAAATATKVVTAVKIKPVPVKVNTKVTTAAGIQLR